MGALRAEVERLKLDAAGMRAAAQRVEAADAQRLAAVQEQVLALDRRQLAQAQALRRRARRDRAQVQAQLARYGAAFASFMATLGQAQQELLGGPQPGGGVAGSGQASDRSWSGADDGEGNSSGMQLVARGSWDSRAHGAPEQGDGEACQRHPLDRPTAAKAHGHVAPSLPQAGDHAGDGMPPVKRIRLQRDGSNGREGSNAVGSLPSNPRQPQQHPPTLPSAVEERPPRAGTGGASAGSGTALTMAWKVESRAVSIVENWLGEVTAAAGQRAAHAAVQGAVAGLHEAMLQRQCPLHASCMVAGFETALLQCAGPRGLSCGDVVGAQARSGVASAAVEDEPFTAVWCRPEVLRSRAFTGLLLGAQQLDARLAGSGGRAAALRREPQQPGLLEQLQARLHLSAAQPLLLHGQAGVDPQACSLAAAAATLYRMQGNEQVRAAPFVFDLDLLNDVIPGVYSVWRHIVLKPYSRSAHPMHADECRSQAMRVLLYDIVVAEGELSARTLPRIAAAVLAWPEVFTAQPHAGSAAGDLVKRALLAALQDVRQRVLEDQARAADDTATAAGSVSGTTSTADRLPGILAAANALEAVLASASGKQSPLAGGKRSGWPASRAAFRETLAAAGQAESSWGTDRDEDRQRCIRAALELARTCLGNDHFCKQVCH